MRRTGPIFGAGLTIVLSLCVPLAAANADDDDGGAPASAEAAVELLTPPPRILPNTLPMLPVQKRLFGVVPNYRADQDSADYHPLTTWQKFKIAEKDTFDWPNYFLLAGFAMQTQVAINGFHGRAAGKMFAGYYARGFGDQIIGNYITEAMLPSLLHEDPRFFRSGQGPAIHRAWRAVRQVMVTRTENGHERFNISEVAGNSAVTAITSLYYPSNRSLHAGAERVGLQIGNDAVSNLLTEFWPDIKQRFLHHHAQ